MLIARAEQQSTAALFGGVARTPEAQHLVVSGWAHELAVPRELLRHRVRVEAVPAEDRPVRRRLARVGLAVVVVVEEDAEPGDAVLTLIAAAVLVLVVVDLAPELGGADTGERDVARL